MTNEKSLKLQGGKYLVTIVQNELEMTNVRSTYLNTWFTYELTSPLKILMS